MTEFTAEQKRKAVERELAFRRRVYPRWVEIRKMTERHASEQIAVMEAIRIDYVGLEAAERLP